VDWKFIEWKKIGAMVTQQNLISFLKSSQVHSGFIDILKVHYRPLICPLDEIINWLPPSGFSAFDIGCGSGQFALLLAQFTKVAKITGIEIDKKLVDNANALLSSYKDRISFEFTQYDGSVLPDSLGGADFVFMIDVLHHIPKHLQTEFIEQLYSKMNKGAHLIIKDIDADSPLLVFNKLHDAVFSQEIGNEWSLKRLSHLAGELGFEIVNSKKKVMYVYPHYTLIVRK